MSEKSEVTFLDDGPAVIKIREPDGLGDWWLPKEVVWKLLEARDRPQATYGEFAL